MMVYELWFKYLLTLHISYNKFKLNSNFQYVFVHTTSFVYYICIVASKVKSTIMHDDQ